MRAPSSAERAAFPHGHYPGDVTMRDYLAVGALAVVAGRSWDHLNPTTAQELVDAWAKLAYKIADAMIVERSK